MFTNLVENLTIDKISLRFEILNLPNYQDLGPDLNSWLVSDILQPLNKASVFTPDFAIGGFYTESKSGKSHFIAADIESSTHILFITGVPKEPQVNEKFRFNPVDFVSYWEDNKIGYLTQIIKK